MMDLYVTQESRPDGTRRTLHLKNIAGGKDVDIFFDLIGTMAPPPVVLDGFIFGIIFYAMRLGQDVRVHGSMSFDALLNLNEFQEAWSLWKPENYKKVKIFPENVVENISQSSRNKAIAAFSGGVDSVFTILRHNTQKLGNGSYPLNESVLMVHGFDVKLNAPDQLAALQERTKPLLDELKLNLLTIRTNLKEVNLQDWEDSFISQLACCLHNYSHDYAYALVGSSEPYDGLVLPWGSNPATDHLLSNKAMRLVHDGAGYSRTEKIEQIVPHKTAIKVIKVCWEGQETNKNCGSCEKCVRTQLNFLAAGMSAPTCFDKPLDTKEIPNIYIRNTAQLAELESIYNYTNKHHINETWTKLLNRRIKSGVSSQSKIRKLIDLILRREFSTIVSKIQDMIVHKQQ